MLLNEIWPDDEILDLTEAGFKDRLGKFAMAGALGAGLLGGYNAAKMMHGQDAASPSSTPASISAPTAPTAPASPDRPTDTPRRSEPAAQPPGNRVQAGGDPHRGYPQALGSQSSAQRSDRIRNFDVALRPLVRNANASITADRTRLSRIGTSGHRITNADNLWIADRARRYDVEQTNASGKQKSANELIRDLLLRVDVIPEDLAMAQAALETGWGTSDLARQGNNFFGQKATRRHQEHQRIRNTDGLDYRSYDNPGHSVQSYMHNINTHPRYEEFRQARARLRRQQGMTSQLMARELSKHLQAYSTNPSYMTDLNRVMNSLRGT